MVKRFSELSEAAQEAEGEVIIRSREDVEVACQSGCTTRLSVLSDDCEGEES